jgi:hypothetical protein
MVYAAAKQYFRSSARIYKADYPSPRPGQCCASNDGIRVVDGFSFTSKTVGNNHERGNNEYEKSW